MPSLSADFELAQVVGFLEATRRWRGGIVSSVCSGSDTLSLRLEGPKTPPPRETTQRSLKGQTFEAPSQAMGAAVMWSFHQRPPMRT